MNFNVRYNIFAEAKAVLAIQSPLDTFKASDIGSFVLAWSSKDTSTSIRGTLMSFGCDSEGEYAMVKPWMSNCVIRYTLVAPLPAELQPTHTTETTSTIWRDPDVKQPGMQL